MTNEWREFGEMLSEVTGSPFEVRTVSELAGGCINRVLRVGDGARSFLVKTNSADALAMFDAEARGLAELAAAGAVRIPEVYWSGVRGGRAMLFLEYIELVAPDAQARRRLGSALARMHRVRETCFGWDIDNFIGSTPQCNAWCGDWVEFLRENRLRPQLELAARNGHARLESRGGRLLERLGELFAGHLPPPSLLHGDLWSGNVAADGRGQPVLFDPAVYYGDREVDLAMTELFGGFGADFRDAYEAEWPLDAGYESRKDVYNLYHVLNHLNLFGGGYAAQAQAIVDRLLEPG